MDKRTTPTQCTCLAAVADIPCNCATTQEEAQPMTPAQEAESELVSRLEKLAQWCDQSQHDKWCRQEYLPVRGFSGEGIIVRQAADHITRLEAALRFGLALYGTDGPARWPVDDRLKFDELARTALGGGV